MNNNKIFLPSETGVYLFKDAQDNILYIGKAKSLKSRVSSYFQKKGKDWKIDSLLEEYHHIDHILTTNETAALLLEAQLIQKHKPKYNVLLKEGQPFLYILFTEDEIKTSRVKKEKGRYYGPFLEKTHARKVYNFLIKTFRLKLCNKKIKEGCLNYHLDICAGNCREDFNKEEYKFRLKMAEHLVSGNLQEIEKNLTEKIKFHNLALEFEKSKNLYQYLENIKNIFLILQTKNRIFRKTKEISLTEKDLIILQNFLNMEKLPKTIDCFDVSHFQSSYIVGSCIRFKDGMPDKENFRRFKIKTLQKQNDYEALQEIVSRRYKNKEDLPDLILIDGGKGQLSAVNQLFPDTKFVSLAKKEEILYKSNEKEGIKLDIKTELGKLLISLRDYAHHFAISYHRKLRSNELKGSK